MASSRRTFLQMSLASSAAVALAGEKTAAGEKKPLFAALSNVGDRFRVVLIADPQVGPGDARGVVPKTTQEKMSRIVDEVNAMDPQPAYVLWDGDLVGSVEGKQVDNFLERAKRLKALSILVHGNHDGRRPYNEFRSMQRQLNGADEVMFSFDCGQWHFVGFPCNLPDEAAEDEILDWLKEDLAANRDRPTMIFEHLHLLPQGLSQLEWYTYSKRFKRAVLALLRDAGNVHTVICGHVHNGILTSLKTAWTYQGTNFITAPTCTASRNFGEELPAFKAGMPSGPDDSGGGYYLVLDFAGDSVEISGRLVGVGDEFRYPARFREYKGEEPLWLDDLASLPTNKAMQSGGFEEGFKGWNQPYRYIADKNPGFVTRVEPVGTEAESAAYLFCREKGQHWARDEMVEVYQKISWTDQASVLTVRYRPQANARNGGGYVRVCLLSRNRLSRLLLFDWHEGEKRANDRLSQNSLFLATGRQHAPYSLIQMGERREAMFWSLPASPEQWRRLQVDLPALIAAAAGSSDSWPSLGIDEVVVAAGAWSLADSGSAAGMWVDDFSLGRESLPHPIAVDGQSLPIGDDIYRTDFGRDQLEKLDNEKRRAGRRKSRSV